MLVPHKKKLLAHEPNTLRFLNILGDINGFFAQASSYMKNNAKAITEVIKIVTTQGSLHSRVFPPEDVATTKQEFATNKIAAP